MTTRRLDRDASVLLVVDIQQRLAPHIAGHEAIVARTHALASAARRFAIPAVATLHCADRIGDLVPPLDAAFDADRRFDKTRFCATDHPAFVTRLEATGRRQVVVTGMETHVCVMQTALGLLDHHFDVFVVADAVGSRAERALDRTLALSRLANDGCRVVAAESVLFEWTREGNDIAFREVLDLVKRLPAN